MLFHRPSVTGALLATSLAALLWLSGGPVAFAVAPAQGVAGSVGPRGAPLALPMVNHPIFNVAAAAPSGTLGSSADNPAFFPSGAWTNITSGSARAPSQRQGFGMAFDPVLNATVVFGGQSASGAPLGDTWEFAHGKWTQVPQTNPPSARWGAGLTYDPDLQALFLFGGRTGAGFLGDSWKFNATGWTPLFVPSAPPPQPARHLLYDSVDHYVLLLSQADQSGMSLGYSGFWTYSAGNWTNITGQVTLNGFANLTFESQADDPSDGYVLLFGGTNSSLSSGAAVTWSYAHGVFTNRTNGQTTRPQNGQGSDAMAYDPVELGVVMVGGRAPYGVTTTSTYLFTAGRWNNLTATAGGPPPGDWDGRLAFDGTIRSDLLFGGNRANLGATVRLTNTSWNLTATFFPMHANATAFPTHGDAPLVVNFTGSYGGGIPPLVPTWRFGDTNASGSASPSHAYKNAGNYTWSFNVTDQVGNSRNVSGTIRVDPTLLAKVGGTPLAGVAPLVVQFHAAPSDGETPYRFDWSFGDGWPNSSLSDPEHAYARSGNYSVTWVVTDQGGGRLFGTIRLSVLPAPAVIPIRQVPASTSEPGSIYVLPVLVTVAIAIAAFIVPRRPPPPPRPRRRVRTGRGPGLRPPYYVPPRPAGRSSRP